MVAARITQNYERIDVLMNNAGARFDGYHETSDGIELTFATNHLGHFLLTSLLSERLVQAPAARIITVSSSSHISASAHGERFFIPLNQAGIVHGPLFNNYGDSLKQVVVPGSLERSILFRRIADLGSGHMPPFAISVLNQEAINLLSAWITNITASGILRITDLGNRSFSLRFNGIPKMTYRIEYTESTGAPEWQTLRSATSNATGMFEVIDTPPAASLRRYYRSAFP